MKRQVKITKEQEETQAGALAGQSQSNLAREFESVEQMLRHDALHTPVPPGIARRLQISMGGQRVPSAAWWKRWFNS